MKKGKRTEKERRQRWRGLLVPLLAIVTALIISGLLIIVTDFDVHDAFTHIPMEIVDRVEYSWEEVSLEEALEHHAAQVEIGDRVRVDGRWRTVVETIDNPERQLTLDEAREIYPELAVGVMVHFNFWQRPMVDSPPPGNRWPAPMRPCSKARSAARYRWSAP